MIEVSASILSTSNIESTKLFLDLEVAKINYFHIDVMDGEFVEQDTSKRMIEYTNLISLVCNTELDVHLMVKNVEHYIEEYLAFNPRIISFHLEAIQDKNEIESLIKKIKDAGCMVGLAVNPDTSIDLIKPYLDKIHVALVMTVVPGKGGQPLIPSTIGKIEELKKYIDDSGLDTRIEVDGGINDSTSSKVIQSGADILVVGNYLISASSFVDAINKLKTNEERG